MNEPVPLRSLLFVPGDSERKLGKALSSGSDALILDLEDSVATGRKAAARDLIRTFLGEAAAVPARPQLYVRINSLASGLCDDDLDAVMPGVPDGIMLPKAEGADDIMRLDGRIAVREAEAGISDGATRILAIATETAQGVLLAGTYRGSSPRLAGLAWGGEDLAAALGAAANRYSDGTYRDSFRLARTLCLVGAVSAGCAAIDTVYPNFKDRKGLQHEVEEAAIDGFTAKLAIHPDQIETINRGMTPSPSAVERAQRIVAAFAAADETGVASLDGEMIDRPHLMMAQRILARAGLA